MLETLRNAFKIKDVRRRIYYVLLMLVVVRIGSQLPILGVDRDFFKNLFASQSNDAFNFFNAFTGGSFEQMSIFALSITPYITSSIIIQLLTIAIPKLEEMQRDGEEGRKKMTAITRYLTVGLALFQSVAMVIGFGNRGWLTEMNFTSIVVAVVTLTGGSAMLMWIGEQITEKVWKWYLYRPDDQHCIQDSKRPGFPVREIRKRENHRKRRPGSYHYHGNHYSGSGTCTYPERWRAEDSGPVFQEDGRKKNDGRTVQCDSSEGEHCRCYSHYLRILPYVFPGSHRELPG